LSATGKTVPFRLLSGLALSLALHAMLVFVWHIGARPHTADDDSVPERRTLSLRVRPVPPPVAVAATPPPTARATATPRAGSPRPAPKTDVIAMPDPAPDVAAAPDIFSVAPPAAPPTFDHEAARKLARQLASEPDPAKAGTAVGQLPPKELATETKAARAIAGAKRRDCKDGLPGGLLGPLLILMDKKDSGCKW
jgi:hypothetical protein